MLSLSFVVMAMILSVVPIRVPLLDCVDGFVARTTVIMPRRVSQAPPQMVPKDILVEEAQLSQQQQPCLSRRSCARAAATIFLVSSSPFVAMAIDDEIVNMEQEQQQPQEQEQEQPVAASSQPPPPQYSIAKCSVSKSSPVCVSTSNVRQLDLYSPPWTYPSTMDVDEVMARLKGAVIGDELNGIVEKSNDNKQLIIDSKRSKLGDMKYRMEFIINDVDHVITYRSSAPNDSTNTDFGLQRRRLNEIRERSSQTFGVMGESLNSADTKSTDEKGYGPIGQLKSFYGLQSGGGFEDVLSQ